MEESGLNKRGLAHLWAKLKAYIASVTRIDMVDLTQD